MCVTYCGAFPLLFEAIDRSIEAGRAQGSEALESATMSAVSDHCWQCKLCYIKCPYTEDEGAYELLDFPRLMAREKAQRARRDGISLVDRVLGEPQMIGVMAAGPAAPMANLVNANRLLRKVAEKATGISADFHLPPMARRRFSRWFDEHRPLTTAGEAGSVVLFPTCYGEFNFPDVPQAAVAVLEKNGFSVECPRDLTCCGMPNLDGGNVDGAKAKMAANVAALLPAVERGLRIVVPGPTCGYTMKKEWSTYLGTEQARRVAASTLDLMEFLDGLRKNKTLRRDFQRGFGKVAYHAACHLRAQKVGIPGARVLGALPDTDVRIIERCSAVDGTWGMKARYYDEGVRYGRKLALAIENDAEDEDQLVVGDCSLAGLRILQETGAKVRHPVELLAMAYGLSQADSDDEEARR
jgi:glycerol-3-phosphate dehydrogenase subunit C